MSSLIPAAQDTTTQPIELNIISISLDGFNSALKINIPVPLSIIISLVLLILLFKKIQPALKNYKTDEITIKEPFKPVFYEFFVYCVLLSKCFIVELEFFISFHFILFIFYQSISIE